MATLHDACAGLVVLILILMGIWYEFSFLRSIVQIMRNIEIRIQIYSKKFLIPHTNISI